MFRVSFRLPEVIVRRSFVIEKAMVSYIALFCEKVTLGHVTLEQRWRLIFCKI